MADGSVFHELNSVKYGDFAQLTAKIQELSVKHNNMPMESIISAFTRTGFGGSIARNNPYEQNRRVKSISSSANNFTKKDVDAMLKDVSSNEQQLREVHHALEYTSYPLLHTRVVYQNLLTYHNYTAPFLINDGDTKKQDFWREWKLIEKLRIKFKTSAVAHEITGQTVQEGKVFYYPRYSVDKAHNKVNHAFLQQLPSDWVKIVGFNNKSKYTLAFNLMYFTKEGTDILQFGDLFLPYLRDFNEVVSPAPKGVGTKLIYASKTNIKLAEVDTDKADVYYQNGRWFYWVTLPIDKVFTFEIDDVPRTVVSPFTGLIIDMLQLSQLEALAMELLSNPLVAILHGEIPYFETKDTNIADQYKLSNAGLMLFNALWDQLMQRSNIGGVGLYAAPFKNMKLESLPEAPNATNIVSSGYKDVMNKAGLSAIMPASDDVRAGLAQISLMLEAQFPKTIYRCFEQMMDVIIENLNLKYDWRFHMFGDVATDEKMKDECRKDMSLGILPGTLLYAALCDRSIFEELSWSDAIFDSGLLEKRVPLATSYTLSSGSGLSSSNPSSSANPPGQTQTTETSTTTTTIDEGGRPESEGVTSEGQEDDLDRMG